MDDAIKNVTAMIRSNVKCDDALKFSQALLNLAHAKQILETKTKGAGS